MKKLIQMFVLAIISQISFLSFGVEVDQERYGTFKIKKEKEDLDIKSGETVIYGKVKSKEYASSTFQIGFQQEGKPKVNYRLVRVDTRGRFEIKMPAQKGVLYCASSNNNEIVVPLRMYKAQHKIRIDFKSTEKSWVRPGGGRPNFGPGVKKPVVYLYNESNLDVKLKLNLAPKGKLSFTYPAYNNGWSVKVSEKGIEMDGKNYPYLFWEGNQPGLNFEKVDKKIEANIVTKKNVISYLESALEKMGLNTKEATDFITFWAPQMIQHEKVAVQFFINEVYDRKIGHIDVDPKPKNSLRVYMIYEAVSGDESGYISQQIESLNFNRDGFTLVEWGGTELSTVQDLSELIIVDDVNMSSNCRCYTPDELLGPVLKFDKKTNTLDVVSNPNNPFYFSSY